MSRVLITVLSGVVWILSLAAPALSWAAETPPVFDTRPYGEAKQAAAEGKKWFIVKGTAVWCGPCKQMDKTTWRDEGVVKWLEANAVAVAVDVDKEPKIAEALAIRAMPTMIAFKDGQEFDRVVGYKSPEDFIAWLEGIARGEKSIEAEERRAGGRGEGGGRVDVRARLNFARSLMMSGKGDEAAAEYEWLWKNMLEHDQAFSGVRLSFMAGYMEELAADDANAKERFVILRDQAAKAIEAEKVHRKDLIDWMTLNTIVGDKAATLAWYDKVKGEARWKPLIKQTSDKLRDLFVESKRWADVGATIERPIAEFNQQVQFKEMMLGMDHKMPEDLPEDVRKEIEEQPHQMLRETAGLYYAGLLAAGREADAEKLAARAKVVDPSAKMVAAMVATALEAGQARPSHIAWLEAMEDKDGTVTGLLRRCREALAEKDKK